MMFYQQKYLKHKSDYSDVKNMFGGTGEEENNYLLHGTNLFYIDDIVKNGLTGKYNDLLYAIIIKYWATIKSLSTEPTDLYVDWFIERQKSVRSKLNPVALSFTGQISVATEYSAGARKFGEGPSRFLSALQKYSNTQNLVINPKVRNEIIQDIKYMTEASEYPGIILAIDVNEFEPDMILPNPNIQMVDILNKWEYILIFPVPADKLYIRVDKNAYIKLTSPPGIEYIKNMKNVFLEAKNMKNVFLEAKNIANKSDIWKTETINNGPDLFTCTMKNNNNIVINVQYDKYKEDTFPYYLQLKIVSDTISVNVVIEAVINNTYNTYNTYNTTVHENKGISEVTSNDILKTKFSEAINIIINKIDVNGDRRNLMCNQVIDVFPELKSLLKVEHQETLTPSLP